MVFRIATYFQIFQLVCCCLLFSNSSQIDQFHKNFASAKLKFQAGDSLLNSRSLASAMQAYSAGRKLLNDSFFALMLARHQDSLSTELVTTYWDSAMTSIRHKLVKINACEFDRCYIYNEEKAANVCLEIIESADSLAINKLLGELEQLFRFDENTHLNNFFEKIYDYLNIRNCLNAFRLAALADSATDARFKGRYMNYIKMYRKYQTQSKQNKR